MGLCIMQCKSLQLALKFHLSALFGIDWQAFSPSKHAVIIYWTLYLIICEGFCAGLPADCNARCNHKKSLVSQKGVQCSQSTDNLSSNWVPYHTGNRSITTLSSWTGAKSMQNPPSPGIHFLSRREALLKECLPLEYDNNWTMAEINGTSWLLDHKQSFLFQ